MSKKKFILLDDHALFLQGLEHVILKSIPNCTTTLFSSIKDLNQSTINFNNVDLLISDMELVDEDIFDLLTELKTKYDTPILVISMHKKLSLIKKCIKLGIEGYILKNDDEYLVDAINKVVKKEKFLSPEIEQLLQSASSQNIALSEREEQIIRFICKGAHNKDISEELHISIETVKTHKRNIKYKLGLSETSEIIEYANQNILL